ncbi:DUF4175 domain-containing protein [Gordonia sp. TBRC 11910]|uniref:DUF4175 domain-containing protein n=1 Tax=Gordonia asplenii TaxID=2725283 RepID=A0A848KUA0_9ACTN|nr:hypothetical protein [Gordonia asplenii]NMO02474.1 DUF4175 domain-containing protein [Gordonia asplenii]
MTTRVLVGVSAAATTAVMAPLWRPGYLLYRDAVSTPRTFLTDTTLGIGGNPPRAVPQDGLIAVLSTLFDGGAVVVTIMTLALFLAGLGYGALAHRILPDAGSAGAAAAALVGIWNPFVAERLLQGHWSLLTGYAALGWILLSALQIRSNEGSGRPWSVLSAAVLCAALTPSGWLVGTVTLVAALTIPLAVRRRWRACAASLAPVAVGMAPWLGAVLVGPSVTTVQAVSVPTFAVRAEPGLGRVLTVLSMGGIWNTDAVPASRQTPWAVVAAVLFIAVVAVGIRSLWQRRPVFDAEARSVVDTASAVGLGALGLVLVASTGPGLTVLGRLASTVGGAGLLRDAGKFVMLAMPLVALAATAFVGTLRRWVPAGFAVGAAALLIVAPLPDLAWGVGGRIAPISYPDEWRAVAGRIPADSGAVALWPGDTVRRFDFARGPSLDPTARMVRAAVAESGRLSVDGRVVDGGSVWADDIHRTLADGGDVAALGVGWVVASAPVPGFGRVAPTYRGPTLTLYRIPAPHNDIGASTTDRRIALTALWLWIGALLCAVIAVVATWPGLRRR